MESKDLASSDAQRVRSMAEAYANYVQKNGVIDVPDDYDIAVQAKKNAGVGH